MRKILAVLFLCLAFLCGIAQNTSGAVATFDQKTASGVFEQNPNICTYELGSLGEEPCRGDTIIYYDPATGVLYYVRQNPWSKFDPDGLFEWNDVTQPFVEFGGGAGGSLMQMLDGLNQAFYHPITTGKAVYNSVVVGATRDVIGTHAYPDGLPKAFSPGGKSDPNWYVKSEAKRVLNQAKEKLFTSRGNGELFVEVGAPTKGMQVLTKSKILVPPMVVKSASQGLKEVKAAIASLEKRGVYPIPGQQPLNIDKILDFAHKMETGKGWDESLNWVEAHRPGVMKHSDGTETILNGHHRHVAEEIAKQRGSDFKLQKETMSSTDVSFKGDWKDVPLESSSKTN